MNKNFVVMLLGLGLALLAGSGIVQGQSAGDVSFGIRPTSAFEDRPETFSYFSYSVEPGAVLSDAALVMNSGGVPVTLKLYAADGITAVNGGTAFAREGQEPTGVNRWLSLSVTEVALELGAEMVVPFTITVPSDASPGQHVAGLVVAAPPIGDASPNGEGGGQFSAMMVQQSAVAVVIDVSGPHVAGLEITGTCLKEQDELGATFVVAVRNTGNILVKGEGSVLIMDRNGQELASNPLKMGTVLAGDATSFQVRHPVHLADGDYLVTAVLNYDGTAAVFGGEEQQTLPPASLTGVEINVQDGQPKVGCEREDEEDAPPPASITEIGSPPGASGGPPIGLIGVSALLLGAFLILAAWTAKRKVSTMLAAPSSRSDWTPTMRPGENRYATRTNTKPLGPHEPGDPGKAPPPLSVRPAHSGWERVPGRDQPQHDG